MSHAITQENHVSAPALIFRAVRERLHATEYQPKNDEDIFAIH
jgi:hypothetical protein